MNLQVALRLGRVSNLPTVWTNVLTGIVLAGSYATSAQVISLMFSLTLFYLGGMYLNDAFDAKIDAVERPERPIPSGQVSAGCVFVYGYGMIFLGVVGLAVSGLFLPGGTGWGAAYTGLALAACITFYNWNHKGNPLSPLVMGACRMLVYIAAGVAVATSVSLELYCGAALLLCYLIGLTFAAKQEHLNHINTLWPLVFLAAPVLYVIGMPQVHWVCELLLSAFLAWVLYALSFLAIPSRINIPRAVISLLAGICLLDAVLIAANGQIYVAGLAAIGFPLTLAFQRWIPGT